MFVSLFGFLTKTLLWETDQLVITGGCTSVLPFRSSRGVDQEYQEQRFPYHGWSGCSRILYSGDHWVWSSISATTRRGSELQHHIMNCHAAAVYLEQMDWILHLGRRPLSYKPKHSGHCWVFLLQTKTQNMIASFHVSNPVVAGVKSLTG